MDANVVNEALHLLVRFATIGGGLWAIWGVVVLAGGLKDHNGPGIQSGVWQLVGGGAPGPEAAQAPAPSVNTQRPSASELAQTGASSSALTSAAFGATGLALIAMRRRARKRSRA